MLLLVKVKNFHGVYLFCSHGCSSPSKSLTKCVLLFFPLHCSVSPQRLRVDVTDRQPRTAWLDTLHSWEATKTETEQKAMEEYSEGGGKLTKGLLAVEGVQEK